MKAKPVSFRLPRIVPLLVILSLVLHAEALVNVRSAQPLDTFNYEFIVDKDGFTKVNITFTTNSDYGSSWVMVPKSSEWTNYTIEGEVTEWHLRDTQELLNVSYYFYEALYFSFNSHSSGFEMNIQFNTSTAAMIIEPDGIFYSPQIGFENGRLTAKVILPEGFNIKQGEAIAYGSTGSYGPTSAGSGSNYVLFDNIPEAENLVRIEVGFKTLNEKAESLTLKYGIFTFETVPRYKEYALKVLALFNRTYGGLVDLFNVTLDNAEARFFLPDFNSLFSVLGYIPFSSDRIGDIYINILSTRYVEGYVEVSALHELVHQFLWKAGISAQTLLWFHEGMAQYVSMGVAEELGYEGAKIMKQDLEDGVVQLKRTVGENFGFIKDWSPASQPQDIGPYYVGAYYVISRLAEPSGGLEYYSRFFRLMNGKKVDDNAAIGYYLSLAANTSVIQTLNGWGFAIPDLYLYSPALSSTEETLNKVNPLFQPYKFLAELLYRQALLNAKEESMEKMQIYLAAAILVARLAPILTLITIAGVLFGAILLALRRKGVFSSH